MNIFLKDKQGRYVFTTQQWNHFRLDGNQTLNIRGKRDVEVRLNEDNAQKAQASDSRILESGKGESYMIKERRDGREEYLELVKCPIREEDGQISGIVALVSDVTERYLTRLEMERLSQTDALTGLLNKAVSQSRIRQVLRESKGSGCALIMLDVDNFKRINDTFGHAVGDRVLSTVGRVIRESARAMDVAGRVGGDEFMLLLRDIPSQKAACGIDQRIAEKAAGAFAGEPVADFFTLSMGIALFPEHAADFDSLYKAADAALYNRKRSGKNGFHLYSPG